METYQSTHIHSWPDIKVTKWDRDRLQHLLSSHARTWSWRAVEILARKLMRAHVVDEKDVPDDIVTMRSRVALCIGDSEINQVVTLAYPSDREFYDDALSVLTPIGAALVGLTEGQPIAYPTPGGCQRTLTVLKILSQPERTKRAECGLVRHPVQLEHQSPERSPGLRRPPHQSDAHAARPLIP